MRPWMLSLFCLNPLHCGAVVASPPYYQEQLSLYPCLNPLHCGAVVASTLSVSVSDCVMTVSQSPSLRGSGRFGIPATPAPTGSNKSQSPSLRGSGRFRKEVGLMVAWERIKSQSPSLRGSGRFSLPNLFWTTLS